MTLKKLITLQRTDTPAGVQRAFAEVERVINGLQLNASGQIVVQPHTGGKVGSLVGPQGLTGPAGPPGPQGPPGPAGTGGGGSLLVSETVSFNVPSAAPGDWSVGSTSIARKSLAFRVSADVSCIVRLYFNADVRDADVTSGRVSTTNPGPGIILAEVGLDLANGRSQYLSPVPVIYSADDPPTPTIYWAVQQTMLVDSEVNVEVLILPLEA